MEQSNTLALEPLSKGQLPPQTEKVALYKHYGAGGELLYVGISLNIVMRLSQHKNCSDWYKDIARVDVDWFESREAALAAEVQAITKLKPLYNIKHQPRRLECIPDKCSTRDQIVYHVAALKPVYTTREAAELLRMDEKWLKYLIERKKIGGILISSCKINGAHGTYERKKYNVSGWHILDYLESIKAVT